MTLAILYYVYLALMGLSFAISMIKLKKIDKASKCICLLLGMTLLSETIGYIVMKYSHNNMPVYHFFNPLELLVIALYFNTSVKPFHEKNIGFYVGILGIIVSFINTVFIQPLHTFNSYFLLFEGFCVICMSLFSFRAMFDDEEMIIVQNPHFWFSVIFLFGSGTTYIYWAIFPIVNIHKLSFLPPLSYFLIIVNTIAYTGFGLVFLLLPQKKQNGL